MEVLADSKPLVLALDDIQWCDQASGDLVAALARRRTEAPVLLALAFRAGTIPVSLESALAAGDAEVADLRALTERECAELAGDQAAEAKRATVFRDSGGNPFYALQLARTEARPGDAGHTMQGVPQAVAASLHGELAALPPAARSLLEAASIAGDPFEPELAYAIAEVSTDDGLTVLDDLLDAALVKPTEVPRRFAFRHPLVRRAVYEGTRAAGGSLPTAARRRRSPPPAPRRRLARITSSKRPRRATARPSISSSKPRRPARRGRPRPPHTGLQPRCACSRMPPPRNASGSSAGWPTPRARSATSRIAARASSRLSTRRPPDTGTRTALLSALAGAENFLGHQTRARQRLTQALESMPSRESPEGVKALLDLATGAFFAADVN